MLTARGTDRNRCAPHPLRRHARFCIVLVAMLCLSSNACVPRPPAPPPAPPSEAVPSALDLDFYRRAEAGTLFRVMPERSELIIHVYRAGPLAHLGHNHVVATKALAGYVFLGDEFNGSRADVYFPVTTLRVDEPERRVAAGDGFESTPSAGDIEGTRANMLGPRVLAAADHPYISATMTPVSVPAPAPARAPAPGPDAGAERHSAMATFRVRGQSTQVPLEITWQRNGETLEARASFELSHEELGLEPFTAAGGALQVADVLDVQLTVRARRLDPPR